MICEGVSKNDSVKVRCHPGAITFDLNDFTGSTCRIKPDATKFIAGQTKQLAITKITMQKLLSLVL